MAQLMDLIEKEKSAITMLREMEAESKMGFGHARPDSSAQ